MPSMNLDDYCDHDDEVRVLDWDNMPSLEFDRPSLGGVRGVTQRPSAKKHPRMSQKGSSVNTDSAGAFEPGETGSPGVESATGQGDSLDMYVPSYAVLVSLVPLLAVLMYMSASSPADVRVLASAGAPWRQPVCDVGVLLKSQGSRLVADSAVWRGEDDAQNLRVMMVQGSTENLKALVGSAVSGLEASTVGALLVVDLFALDGGSNNYIQGWDSSSVSQRTDMLRSYCSEVLRRQQALTKALDGWGGVLDPLASGPACQGVGDDAWDGGDSFERLLALETGYERHPYSPGYVGSAIPQGGRPDVNLFVSVGYPFTYEAVAWFLALAKRFSDARGAKVVMYGFASSLEVASTVSAACDRLWAPSGVVDLTDDVQCDGTPPIGKRYFMLSFQGNLDAKEVARACGSMVL